MKKLLLSLFCVLALTFTAKADIAPAEQINYFLTFEGVSPSAVITQQSEQIQCDDNQCLNPKPLGSFGIQKLDCDKNSCYAVSYEMADYQKLILKFADGTVKESNVFAIPENRINSFTLSVGPQSLTVKPSAAAATDRTPLFYAVCAMAFVFLAEVLTALLFVCINELPLKITVWFAVLNLFTIPANWFFLSKYTAHDGILWLAACLAEFTVLAFAYRRKCTLQEIFGLTLFSNVSGYCAVMILSFILTFF